MLHKIIIIIIVQLICFINSQQQPITPTTSSEDYCVQRKAQFEHYCRKVPQEPGEEYSTEVLLACRAYSIKCQQLAREPNPTANRQVQVYIIIDNYIKYCVTSICQIKTLVL